MHTWSVKLVGAARFSYYFFSKPAEEIIGYEINDAIEHSQEEYWRLDAQRRVMSGSSGMVKNDLGQTTTITTTPSATATTATLSSPPATTAVTATTSALYKFGPLKKMNIFLDTSYRQYAADGFSFPNTLTRIVFTVLVTDHRYPRIGQDGVLWGRCPLLEVLEIHGTPEVDSTWTPVTTTTVDQKRQLPLRSLVLDNIRFDQGSLENLLTFTPKLKLLKLIAMPLKDDVQAYDWLRFLRQLQSLPISLDTIHISTHSQQTPPEVLQAVSEICTSPSSLSE